MLECISYYIDCLIFLVIDCGVIDPTVVSGAVISLTAGIDTLYNDSFTFECADGAPPSGASSLGNNVVTCQANGQWDLRSLFCQGRG